MFTVETITGSRLVGENGSDGGPESTGRVHSRHNTREAAERALAGHYLRCRKLGQMPSAAIFDRADPAD
jgi:hypothetical protein